MRNSTVVVFWRLTAGVAACVAGLGPVQDVPGAVPVPVPGGPAVQLPLGPAAEFEEILQCFSKKYSTRAMAASWWA